MFNPEYMEIEQDCSDCLVCATCVTIPGFDAELAGAFLLADV